MGHVPQGHRVDRLWLLALGVLLVVATFARFETLTQRPIWLDEHFVIKVVRNATSVAEVWRVGEADYGRHPPLHYVLSYWTYGLARPEVALRAPSAVFGVLYVAILALLGRKLFGRRVGLLAAGMAALAVYHIEYSQEGRAYSLITLLAVGQGWLVYAALERLRAWHVVAFVACGAASVYTHHIGLVTQGYLGAIVAVVGIAAWRRRARAEHEGSAAAADARRTLVASGALLAGLAAVGLTYLPNLDELQGFFAAPEQLTARHTLRLSPRFFYDLASRWGSGDGWVAILYLTLFCAGCIDVLRRRDARAGLLLWFAAPIAVYVAIPFSKFFSIRYAMTALPAFTLLSAAGAVFIADSLARVLERSRAAWRAPRTASALLSIVAVALLLAQLSAYSTFRVTKKRCSTFYRDPAVLRIDDHFCERFIVLNSLNPNHRYLLRRVDEAD